MKKIDFAIHLFTAARAATGGDTKRVPIIALLILLEITRRGATAWHHGPDLARSLGLVPNTLSCACRSAREAGYLESRQGTRHTPGSAGTDPFEWRATPAGLRIVEELLTTQPAPVPA